MLRSLYEWRVWDVLKGGATVYAILLNGDRPKIRELSSFTMQELAYFMRDYTENVLFYEVCPDGPEDADESA